MNRVRGLLLAFTAMGLAACEASADQSPAPSGEATAKATRALPPKPNPSPSVEEGVAATLTPQQAEQAFADAVRAVAVSIGDDSGKAAPTNPDDVYTPLRKAGLIGKDFDGMADYGAWSRPRRPLGFMGHSVMLVMAEDMREAGFIGCCVNRGVSLILRMGGDRAALQQFATETRCKLEPARNSLYFDTMSSDLQPRVDPGDLLALSCHERDIYE